MTVEKVAKQPDKAQGDASGNGKPPAVRYASESQFKKAHDKTRKVHAGLFRRLAE